MARRLSLRRQIEAAGYILSTIRNPGSRHMTVRAVPLKPGLDLRTIEIGNSDNGRGDEAYAIGLLAEDCLRKPEVA